MKKLFYIGVLSAFLLAACGEEEVKPKEETPTEEKEVKEDPTKEKPVTAQTEASPSEAQNATIEAFKSNDFMKFADAFYGLSASERSDVYRSTVEGAMVTWTGIITDLDTVKDSIIVMGKTDAYNGADWITLGNENADLVPYVIIVEMTDPSVKTGLKKGDSITLKGEVGARGDKEVNYNWKLYKGEIVK
ncbi:hypothetical protein MPH48_03590 [Lysinibacillus fusiformis]|uniref:hypothetical protein n=1 Tax=Lysinibacillus fusiformis TaxID=28031 RepID=UPI001F4E92B0|nr:hypothetical protein [Lysinibacillus fusiformis]MCK1987182.1 hypothetical protein [Lysinibacillus fusiformis]